MAPQLLTSGPPVRQVHFSITFYEWQERRWRLFKRTLRSWAATSVQMPNWTGVAGTRAELEAELIPAVRFYFEDQHGSVIVTRSHRVELDDQAVPR